MLRLPLIKLEVIILKYKFSLLVKLLKKEKALSLSQLNNCLGSTVVEHPLGVWEIVGLIPSWVMP